MNNVSVNFYFNIKLFIYYIINFYFLLFFLIIYKLNIFND